MTRWTSLRLLRYFVTVADEGHFGRAAAKLFITPPALTQQIRRLEHEVGFSLLDRALQDAYVRHDVVIPISDVEPSEAVLCTRPEDRSPRVALLRRLVGELSTQAR
jgi:DNA-binding transcriptional LysR family regulator